MIIVNDLKPGTTFENEGNIFVVLDIQHNKTAMRQMIVKVKVKNLRTGVINEISFTGGDKVEQAHIDKREMQYLMILTIRWSLWTMKPMTRLRSRRITWNGK